MMKCTTSYIIMTIVMINLILAIMTTGCGTPADSASTPSAVAIELSTTSVDVEGITKVELLVDGQVMAINHHPDPVANTPYVVNQAILLDEPGPHKIQVQAYNTTNGLGQMETKYIQIEVQGGGAFYQESRLEIGR